MATAAAVIILKEKELVALFQRAGALSPATAQGLATLQAHEGVAFRRLQQHAVIREAEAGRFYLDEPTWTLLISMRRRLMLVVFVIMMAVLIGMIAMPGKKGP
jgi:hypothetical protein